RRRIGTVDLPQIRSNRAIHRSSQDRSGLDGGILTPWQHRFAIGPSKREILTASSRAVDEVHHQVIASINVAKRRCVSPLAVGRFSNAACRGRNGIATNREQLSSERLLRRVAEIED